MDETDLDPEASLQAIFGVDSNSEVFSPVIFRVGPEEVAVRANRDALTRESCVFLAMLRGPLAEKGEIIVPDSSPDVFSQFIRYLETGNLDDPGENITDLLYLAKKYSVESLEQFCVYYLCNNLCPDTAFDILQLAHTFDEEGMLDKAIEVIIENLIDGRVSTSFTDLPHELFRVVISSSLFDEHPFAVAVSSWAEAECFRKGLDVNQENKQRVLGEEFIPEIVKVSFLKAPRGWIYFTCNYDILLHGFSCCSLQTQSTLHVELFTTRRKETLENVYLIQTDMELPATPADEDGSVCVPLSKPMVLRKDTKYSLQVILKYDTHASRFGAAGATNRFSVEKYTFTVTNAPSVGMQKLVTGLIFTDYKLWRENRFRCLEDRDVHGEHWTI